MSHEHRWRGPVPAAMEDGDMRATCADCSARPASPGPGYEFIELGRCAGSSCRRVIFWWRTPRDKRSPHDEDGTSHFATCPEQARFRRTAVSR